MTENLSIANVEQILIDIKANEKIIDEAKNRRDQSVDYFKSLIANADKNFDLETADARATIEILKNQLQRYFDDNAPTNRKTLKFAAGTFGYLKSQTKYYFNGEPVDANNADFLAACKKTFDGKNFIRTKEFLDWAALKKELAFDDPHEVFLTDTGEIIAGLQARKVFNVKTS
ncbi:MAG: host-nuclease inhibitor Gam family protein [Selenomonadaceae bacterium]|nr:host-nuclease inhibitor Gam family protein [Selenomonadaceae bacterium]